jgi:chromosome segregation ATPase
MKTIIKLLLLLLITANVKAQEVRSTVPPTDDGVREQTEQAETDVPDVINEKLNLLDSELHAIMTEAENSGRETERYQALVNSYKQRRERISRDLEEGYETDSETEHNIRLLEAQLQAIKKEVGMAEPGTPEE